jgi:hypothetical protein
MRLVQVAAAALCLTALACKTGGADSSDALDDTTTPATPGDLLNTVVGLDILQNKPAKTQIPADIQPTSDWGYSSGREYWLYSSRGNFMTFNAGGKYAPYQNSAGCAGLTEDPNSACSVSPSKVAQACQYLAGATLKAILDSQPEEYLSLKQQYGGSLSMFGWMNDGHSDGDFSTPTWQGPFIWRGSSDGIEVGGECPTGYTQLSGYLKWVSSVNKQGVCRSPSRGQFNALMAKIKECLELGQAQQPAPAGG